MALIGEKLYYNDIAIRGDSIQEFTLWDNGSGVPIKVGKVTPAMPSNISKKYTAHLIITEHTNYNSRDNQTGINLMDVLIGSDDLADVLNKSHGHLGLAEATDKQQLR